ncbi:MULTISPECIES: GTP-binding protein [Burkholderiaceae]|uniref:CobW family GTP-binding protein n=1 Tax=Burkholderiaceae TaxID=119060 RepID=UPI00141F3A91|nr:MULTISPECIES: GTP-binding protein [Burkholderiaceae]MBN3846979.1 GTP-binding protein [Paraburkholderia sp. Ac-20342]NIF54870.1 GTP-binding protein [Burkholderia sp. Ax-1724]
MSTAYDVIPVTIVTGFLGSGKSTLLSDVLTGEVARDTAVLVNEFGSVGLDQMLVGTVDTRTVLLDQGCLCCAVRGELKDSLVDLFSRRARGEIAPFSRLVIETSGLAMPTPIIATLLSDPFVSKHYVLHATVTVVDAVNFADQRDRHPEWLAQVIAADRILVSKADLAGPRELQVLRDTLASRNPAADIVIRDAATNPTDLLALLTNPASSDDLIRRVGESVRVSANANTLGGRSRGTLMHREELSATHVESCCLTFDKPLDWVPFTLWLTLLLNRHGSRILRVKGVVWMRGFDSPAAIHAVHHLVHPVIHLDPSQNVPRVSVIVFIVEDLDCAKLSDSFERFMERLG